MSNCRERYPVQFQQDKDKKDKMDKENIQSNNKMSSYKLDEEQDHVFNEKTEYEHYDIESQQKFGGYDEISKPYRFKGFLKLTFITGLLYLFVSHLGTSLINPFSSIGSIGSIGSYERDFNITELSDAYLNVLKHSNLASEWLKKYTSEPHLAGTNYGLVEFTSNKFEEFGFQSSIEAHNLYINYPGKENTLKLLKPDGDGYKVVYQPTLVEDVLKEDPTTNGTDLIPAFHGYSANGNVTGPLVFANYGTREDFDLLKSKNVNIDGSVVIVRYGKIFRGLKVKFAQESGAIGVIIYSDPADDYVPEDEESYPDGPGRNPSSIQRGSVQFLSSLPGDPSRFTDRSPESLANLTTIPQIPSLPISYKEAEPILSSINGHGLNLGFHGGLKNFSYVTGPSNHQVNIFNNNTYTFTDLWNVYGLYEGHDTNEVIIVGNHRDAWIKGGASDPNSGSAALLEVARSLGELFKLGWKPQKSILLASWDGEEYGLLGSTAFAEKFSEEIGKKVVGYLNMDVAVSGSHLNLAASPIMNEFLLNVADQVSYPKTNQTLKEHFLNESHINILGSGSDYTSFYEHLGVTSVDLGFGVGKGDAVYHYHSNYDSYHWMATYADPGFKLHNALAQYLGLLIINLSEPKLLQSYQAHDYSQAIKLYFDELVEEIPNEWLYKPVTVEDIETLGCHFMKNEKNKKKKNHHNFTLTDLINSTYHELKGFNRVSINHDHYTKSLQKAWEEDVSKSKNPFRKFIFNRKVKNANNKLKHLEKEFLYEGGLNGRDWFKHVVFASGRYTGYAGQKLPGLTEALEDHDFEETARWIGIIKRSIKKGLISLVV